MRVEIFSACICGVLAVLESLLYYITEPSTLESGLLLRKCLRGVMRHRVTDRA